MDFFIWKVTFTWPSAWPAELVSRLLAYGDARPRTNTTCCWVQKRYSFKRQQTKTCTYWSVCSPSLKFFRILSLRFIWRRKATQIYKYDINSTEKVIEHKALCCNIFVSIYRNSIRMLEIIENASNCNKL